MPLSFASVTIRNWKGRPLDVLRNDHFGKRETVEDGSLVALVVERDVVEDQALTVVEADVELPVLPLKSAAVHLERHTSRLGDVERLNVSPVSSGLLHISGSVASGRDLAQRPAHLGDVNSDDGALVGIVDGAEVKRILVLEGIHVGAIVHQSLLKANIVAISLVIANSPGVAVHLVHVLLGDSR